MTRLNNRFLDLSDKARSEADAAADRNRSRWHLLCERYLPVKFEESVWRFNRRSNPLEPSQGWKLHISATILEACDLFERVAPFLISEDAQFKAPNSLDELSKLNCGLQYGYHQVGKLITVYPSMEEQALALARKLHELTKKFFPVSVPFDEQYLPGSSVFYRYGAYTKIDTTDENGKTVPAIRNLFGDLVPDDRQRAVPEWLTDPFADDKNSSNKSFADTPLATTYRIFRAITQRGKGGTYQAIDLSLNQPRLCIIKEGRKNGELGWNGQDGYFLVKNEFEVLSDLKAKYEAVPQILESFEIDGNFYFAMEFVEGKSLSDIMQPRRRRFPFKQITKFAIEISGIIENIHQAGWVWNDCKPANLIITKGGFIRPIDFEGAYPIDQSEPFDWNTRGFTRPTNSASKSGGKSADLYALGAVLYFLLTGRLYDSDKPVALKKWRRDIPPKLVETVEKLLLETDSNISKVGKQFEKILNEI